MRHDAQPGQLCWRCGKVANDEDCNGRELTDEERAAVLKWNPWCFEQAAKHPKQEADFYDDAQEAALRMCLSARTYRPDNPKRATIGTHLAAAGKFRLRDAYRARMCRGFTGLKNKLKAADVKSIVPTLMPFDAPELSGEGRSQWDNIEGRPDPEPSELADDVQAALDSLPPRERYAVVECVMRGRSATEVGRELGVTKERGRQVRDRGLLRLREMLAQHAGV